MSVAATSNDDNFAAAFALAAKDEEGTAPAPAPAAATTPATETPAAPAAEAASKAEGEQGTEPAAAAEPPASGDGGDGGAAPAPATSSEPPAEGEGAANKDEQDLLDRLASLIEKAPKRQEPAKPAEPAAPAEPAEPEGQQPEAPPLLTKEEEEFLKEYEKDWPDVAKAQDIKLRAAVQQAVAFVFQNMATTLKPYLETVTTLAQRTHLADVQSKVADYGQVRDQVVEWVDKQPTYLRKAMTDVINNGDADEIADLINRWRQDTGSKVTAPAAAPAPAKKADTQLPAATMQAVAALAPVSSKRSAVPQSNDPNDFDAAFEIAAKDL